MSKQIFVFSAALDKPTTAPVIALLLQRGYEVLDYEADKVANGEAGLSITIGNGIDAQIIYKEKSVYPRRVAAAWCRRPNLFGPIATGTDRATRGSLDLERRASQQFIEDSIPIGRWLNSPDVLRHQEADHKLGQLLLAQKVGFRTPLTIVGNEWRPIASTLGPDIIYKSFWGQRMGADKRLMLFTTPLKNMGPYSPPMRGLPYPGIWQDQLPKRREWRITVIGDQIFEAVIYHNKSHTKDDWRRHTLDAGMHWERGSFPAEEKKKCLKYCEQAHLRMGMFDFIEDSGEELTFLECNPNGQYMWLEDELHLPLSEAVADELIRIAEGGAHLL